MINKDIKEVLISEKEIVERSKEIGSQISKDYENKNPILIALLKGSVPFLSELIKHITVDMEIDFMDVSSYDGTVSTGEVRINKDLDRSIKECDVLIVEDIVDTGRTLRTVMDMLQTRGANSVKVVSLLDKKEKRVVNVDVDYVGFNILDEFVVGFGLDYNQKYRNLPYIGILKEDCYKE